jgi:eukaryotic-like serine/threonine-protein kinase
MMALRNPSDVERRALALFERLADRSDGGKLRARMVAREPADVIARLAALESVSSQTHGAIPTLIPGSGDIGEAALPPARVGTFRLVEHIGRGGMGDVWLGERDDGLYEQKVAIKLIQRHALARAASAFDDERRFLAKLEHPNIARLIDGGVSDDGLPWLAMEFVEGTSIDAAMEALPAARRVDLFLQVADAVQFAHSRLIAHADIKPGNIMVTPDARVKLLDFGVAGLIGGASILTTGSGPLTGEFASPQRLAGAGPSVADDVFALGKTLALILGERTDVELASIAAKAQAKRVDDRYGSVAELIADLGRWQEQLPVSSMPDLVRYRAAKFVDRHRIGVLATGAAMILLSAATIVATSNYVRAEQTRVRAEARFGEVQQLVGFMLFDLYDELARQPGSLAKRAEIARTSALYLDKLRLSDDAPADLRLDAALSYRRLAAIEGLPGAANLGRPDRAAAALGQAERLLRGLIADQPGNAAAVTALGWVLADQWLLSDDGDVSARLINAARGLFAKSVAIDDAQPAAALGMIALDAADTYRLIWNDQPAEARGRGIRALAALRAQQWPRGLLAERDRLELRLIKDVGDATYYAGDAVRALAVYQSATPVIAAQRQRWGSAPHLQVAESFAAYNVSSTLSELGRNAEGLAIANRAVTMLKALLAAEQDASAEKILLMLYGQQAIAHENLGDLDAAMTPLNRGVALREARHARSPNDYQGRRDLAIGLAQLARIEAILGRSRGTCQTARRAVSIWDDLAQSGAIGQRDSAKEAPIVRGLAQDHCFRAPARS